MVKTLIGLAPLTIAIVVYGAVVWILMGRNIAIGKWLFGAFLAGHGLVHAMFALPRPASAAASGGVDYPFDLSQSWLVTAGLDAGLVRGVGFGLIGIVIVGYVLASLATIGQLVPETWWQGLVIVSTTASAALLAIGFAPGLALGFAIDAVLVWIALAARWSPTVPLGTQWYA